MKYIHKTLATGFGSGYTPIAPGTAGAIVGCLMLWGYLQYSSINYSTINNNTNFQLLFLGVIILTTLIGVWNARTLEPEWGEDPQRIVIDEIVGVWINLLFVPLTLQNILIGLVLFRFFDILKPLGIRKMERFKNGWGVMLDDVVAGIYGNIVLQIILYFM